jgi:RHS repeat-associated protein
MRSGFRNVIIIRNNQLPQNHFRTDFEYDANGNITQLQRNRNNTLIDNLSYSYYSNGNRLKSVADATGNTAGYAPNTGQYLYDANGNMTYDPSKKITVSYNPLNLPQLVEFDNNDFIEYTATGTKLRKTVTSWKTATGGTTDYAGQFLYRDNELSCIFTPVGRIVPMQYNDETFWKHEYNLKDHLGNTRVVFAAHPHGQPELMQQTSYYPFGMTLQQQNFGGALNQPNKLLYNGKELQDDELAGVSLDWYDYGARFYDPVLARWQSIDPHAESYYNESSYSFVGNNPIANIDPTGMDWFYYKIEGEEEASWNWHKGSEYNHTYTYTENGEEKTGSITLQGSEYLVEYSITGTNDDGASVGTVNVYKQQDIVASQDGVFTGTNQYSGTDPADKGTYFMALNVRDANGPQNMNADESNPEATWGMQKIPNNTIIPMRSDPTRGYSINASYGNGRIRLIPSEQVSSNNLLRYGYKDRGLYLHGKKDTHNWTHGCVCDKTESIFNYLWNNVYKRTPFVIK